MTSTPKIPSFPPSFLENFPGDYRFSFQSQEIDPEYLSGAVSFKYRVHDARIGRFLSVDPLAPEYPWNSVYAFSENRVLDGIELEGLEFISYTKAVIKVNNQGYTVLRVYRMSETFQDSWAKAFESQYGKKVGSLTDSEYIEFIEPSIEIEVVPQESFNGRSSLMDDGWQKFIDSHNNIKVERRRNGKLKGVHQDRAVKFNQGTSKGLLIFEVAGLAYDGYHGWGAMLEIIDLNEANKLLNEQVDLLFDAIHAINNYTTENQTDPELTSGENGVNLVNFVLYGEKAGNNEDVFKLGEKILDAEGKNNKTKFRAYVSESDEK